MKTTIKKWLGMLLAAVLFCGLITPAPARTESAAPAEPASKLAEKWSSAQEKAASWISETWGSVAKRIDRVWNDSTDWASTVWSDVSTWAEDTWNRSADTLSAWWVSAFNRVTEKKEKVWSWLAEKADTLRQKKQALFEAMKKAIGEEDSSASSTRDAFVLMMDAFGIQTFDIDRVWHTIELYAEKKGFTTASTAKLMLPSLLELEDAREAQAENDEEIPAIIIAQYLTGVVDNMELQTEEEARACVQLLNETLNGSAQ